MTMNSQQQKYRNFSTDSLGRDRTPSDDGYYQGMLKSTDGRKGTSMAPLNCKPWSWSVTLIVCEKLLGRNKVLGCFNGKKEKQSSGWRTLYQTCLTDIHHFFFQWIWIYYRILFYELWQSDLHFLQKVQDTPSLFHQQLPILSPKQNWITISLVSWVCLEVSHYSNSLFIFYGSQNDQWAIFTWRHVHFFCKYKKLWLSTVKKIPFISPIMLPFCT